MTLERWKTFSRREQLLFIGSEFERAKVAEREGDQINREAALARAIALIDLSRKDAQWAAHGAMLDGLRVVVEEFRSKAEKPGVELLYQVL